MEKPVTEFEWAIYADATFAGLSVLIPLPLVDLAFEHYFKRRMPRTIARHRKRQPHPAALRVLNRWGCSPYSCLLFVPWLAFKLLTRLSRKILYFLTVKEASDMLAYYWHRAFLIDYALRAGHLEDATSGWRADRAMKAALDNAETSPLRVAAQQIVQQSPRVMSLLWRAVPNPVRPRNRQEDVRVARVQATLRATWNDLGNYLQSVADQYQVIYEEVDAGEGSPPASR